MTVADHMSALKHDEPSSHSAVIPQELDKTLNKGVMIRFRACRLSHRAVRSSAARPAAMVMLPRCWSTRASLRNVCRNSELGEEGAPDARRQDRAELVA